MTMTRFIFDNRWKPTDLLKAVKRTGYLFTKSKITQFFRSGLTSSSKSATLYAKLNNRDTQCQAGSMSVGQRCLGKRESGARPERSGHCERGERLQGPLCQRHEKAQPIADPRVRKPAETIRCTASEESGSPGKASDGFVCVCPASAFFERQTPFLRAENRPVYRMRGKGGCQRKGLWSADSGRETENALS